MNEKQIIQGCKDKNPRAQRALVDTYSRKLYGICMRYMKDEMMAKDALQDSLIKILNNMHLYKEQGTFESWLATITVRQNIQIIRKEKVRWTEELNEASSGIQSPDVHLKLEKEEVMKYIFSMPYRYRVAITMFLVEGFSHKEIAQELNINIGTSRSLVSRGRQMIREAFGDEEGFTLNNLTNLVFN